MKKTGSNWLAHYFQLFWVIIFWCILDESKFLWNRSIPEITTLLTTIIGGAISRVFGKFVSPKHFLRRIFRRFRSRGSPKPTPKHRSVRIEKNRRRPDSIDDSRFQVLGTFFLFWLRTKASNFKTVESYFPSILTTKHVFSPTKGQRPSKDPIFAIFDSYEV